MTKWFWFIISLIEKYSNRAKDFSWTFELLSKNFSFFWRVEILDQADKISVRVSFAIVLSYSWCENIYHWLQHLRYYAKKYILFDLKSVFRKISLSIWRRICFWEQQPWREPLLKKPKKQKITSFFDQNFQYIDGVQQPSINHCLSICCISDKNDD